MKLTQLPLFVRKKFDKVVQQQVVEPVVPTAESRVTQTLPAYLSYLRSQGYSESTVEKYFGDIKKFSLFIREKKLGKITTYDIEQWISGLLSTKGEKLDRKTVNRKVSAIINYFLWLAGLGVITNNPATSLPNARV
jgi:site-specific recombinase XerD